MKAVISSWCTLSYKERRSLLARWWFAWKEANLLFYKRWSSTPCLVSTGGLPYTTLPVSKTDLLKGFKLINKYNHWVEILFSISVILFSQNAIWASSLVRFSVRFSICLCSCKTESSFLSFGSCAIIFLFTGLARNFYNPNLKLFWGVTDPGLSSMAISCPSFTSLSLEAERFRCCGAFSCLSQIVPNRVNEASD